MFALNGKSVSFPGITVYFFSIVSYTEDQLRHPALWTELLGL